MGDTLHIVYAMGTGRKLLSSLNARETLLSRPGDKYIEHTVYPMWEAAQQHLKFENEDQAIQILREKILNFPNKNW